MPRDRKFRNWREEFRAISRSNGSARLATASFGTSSFGASTSPSISDVQAKLNSLGASPPLVLDGKLGPMTVQAIRAFQGAHGLAADGNPGPLTLSALGFLGATAVQAPPGSTGNVSLPVPANHTVLESDTHTGLGKTVVSPDDAIKAISKAYQKVVGSVPRSDVLNVLTAQSALETGNWQLMYRFNFGGIKAQASDPYVQVFDTTERINGVTVPMKQTFAAHTNIDDGAKHYVDTLKARANWWNGAMTGDPLGFAQGLASSPAYFTADPAAYAQGLARFVKQNLALAEKYAVPIGAGIGGIVALVALGFGGLALWERYHS